MMSAGDPCQPLVCSLSPNGLRERKALIDQLLARGMTGLAPIPGGVRARFPDAAQTLIAELFTDRAAAMTDR